MDFFYSPIKTLIWFSKGDFFSPHRLNCEAEIEAAFATTTLWVVLEENQEAF